MPLLTVRDYIAGPQAVNRTVIAENSPTIPRSRCLFEPYIVPNRLTPTGSRECRPRGIVSPAAESLLS